MKKIVLLQTIMTEKSEYQKSWVEQMFMGLWKNQKFELDYIVWQSEYADNSKKNKKNKTLQLHEKYDE